MYDDHILEKESKTEERLALWLVNLFFDYIEENNLSDEDVAEKLGLNLFGFENFKKKRSSLSLNRIIRACDAIGAVKGFEVW